MPRSFADGPREVTRWKPRSFDEMPLGDSRPCVDRKTVIINLTMMEPIRPKRAGSISWLAAGTLRPSIGHQERVGESIFLFAPSCVPPSPRPSGEEPLPRPPS